MMNEFAFYLNQGIQHILDIEGVDHMLFVCLLCAKFKPNEYRKLLLVLTAFTVGHSVSLLFTSLGYRIFSQYAIEFLILVTILITGASNLIPKLQKQSIAIHYSIASIFGLVHGMGFSNFFQSMMMGIDTDSIVLQVLAFNIGIELGQLIIVSGFVLAYLFYSKILSQPHKYWRISFSCLGIVFSLWWIAA